MGTISYSLPVSGQPNSTEDPKVTSALTALLTLVNGHIDAANLNPSSGILVAGAWTALTLSVSPFVNGLAGGYTPSARLEGDIVRLKGQLVDAGGGTITNGTTLATLPVGMRPSQLVQVSAIAGSGGTPSTATALQITTGGLISATTNLFGTGYFVTLDGVTFTLS